VSERSLDAERLEPIKLNPDSTSMGTESMTDIAPTATDTVLAERRGRVLVLTLNRPDRLNAWNDTLEERYYQLLDEAEADPEVRAIVVTGAGRGFCAGADMDDLEAAGEGTRDIASVLRNRPRPRTFPLTIRKPMIAAINGAAAGLGLVEAMYCDIRFSTPEAKFTTAFARRGLIAEYGLSWLLPRLIGQSAALDLLLSARVIRGEEAHRLGLVDRLASRETVVDEAVAYAAELAEHCSPTSMAIIKAQVQADLDRTFAEAVAAADDLMIESFTRPDVVEGVKSYNEQRPPAFPGLPTRS
jgi:enoyl-CoA hydratase/carnithine racemase